MLFNHFSKIRTRRSSLACRNWITSHNQILGSKNNSARIILYRQFTAKKQEPPSSTEWRGILTRFVPVGLCLIAVMQWRYYRKHMGSEHVANNWEIKCYCLLPLRSLSRCWGWIADINLPHFLRSPVYTLYSNTFGVNISEALNQDLTSYPSLADFFSRALKDNARKIDTETCIISPADGTVLNFGPVQNDQVEQVKGVTYSLQQFLGHKKDGEDYRKSLLHNPVENTLYQCVIYLAPGDYHRFHSPTEWKPTHRKHYSGELLSVNPAIAKWIPGLFCLNERAVYLGQWKYGFFSYTAVGATNVGTVRVYFDKTLHTNVHKKTRQYKDICLGNKIHLKRGDPVGEFRMGSTIVLIFEAPKTFKFSMKCGDHVKMGESLGCVSRKKFVDKVHETGSNLMKGSI